MSEERAGWIERWHQGDLYREIAADAGVSENTVGEWFRRRGYYRYDREEAVPYSEYPPSLRRLLCFYPEDSPQRRWLAARLAAWWQRQTFR